MAIKLQAKDQDIVFMELTPDDRMQGDSSRNSLSVRVSAKVTTQLMSSSYGAKLPMIGITEFPKSGGTWVGQVLSTYLGIPFPQRPKLPVLMRSVWHGHWLPPLRADVLVRRDPRDCYVSLLHHRIKMANTAVGRECNSAIVKKFQKHFPSAVKSNRVSATDVEKYFDFLLDGNFLGEPCWLHFNDNWGMSENKPKIIEYSEARLNPERAFGALIIQLFGVLDERILQLSLQRYDFSTLKSKSSGFVRAGVGVDGWKNEIPSEIWPKLNKYFKIQP